ncbi:ATP-dependent helicase rhp16 [Dictyocoela muelleri]|nr:ATP-dependent helicase rhp16 [Dictyocoela muelleri]
MKIDIREKDLKVNSNIIRKLTPLEHEKINKLKKSDTKIYSTHPSLEDLENKFLEYEEDEIELLKQPASLKNTLLPYQIKGLSWMKNRENSPINGGILADEMGLGKTLQMIALILTGNEHEITLIITPTIAIGQWLKEFEKHAPGLFDINLYYGAKRKIDFENKPEKSKIKIVLSTYGTIEREYKKVGDLYKINFYRLVIDEAHAIKDSKCSTNNAISNIKTEKRWALTGTPVQNRVGDLYSLVKFLKLDPHSYYFCKRCPCKTRKWLENSQRRGFCGCGHFGASHFSWWNRRITNMVRDYGFTDMNSIIFKQLEKITSHLILRRTKDFLNDELGLPPKKVEILRCYFSKDEKNFYENLYTGAQKQVMAYKAIGQITHHCVNIFTLLQRMRLAVNHPYLITKQQFYPVCGYCNDEADDPVISSCKHVFCREEVKIFMNKTQKCPVCKVKMTIDLVEIELTDEELSSIDNESNSSIYTHDNLNSKLYKNTDENDKNVEFSSYFPVYDWMSSSKIECLIQKLFEQKSDEKIEKSIIFSQFVTFLELLRWKLERAGFRCLKIYGSMPLAQRRAAIENFNKNPEITILLISLKAGGVALDLTEASNVFIMDLWWNPAVEDQAMDRIHRIGQYRPVKVYKLVVQDSIESKILILQEKKRALMKTAIQNDKDALESLTEEDLVFLFS